MGAVMLCLEIEVMEAIKIRYQKKKTKGPSIKDRPLEFCLADRSVTLISVGNIIQLNVIANDFTRIHGRVMNFRC